MATLKKFWGPALYGATFTVLLPLLLVYWALSLEGRVKIPLWDFGIWEWLPIVGGFVLMSWGMSNLFILGRGLPMNAFPPPLLVKAGIYRWLKHPIYVGAGLLAMGLSLVANSSAGFHVVTPVLLLGMVALVFGFEGPDLQRRFPPEPNGNANGNYAAYIGLPGRGDHRPILSQRIGVLLAIFVPWLLVYQWIIFQGQASGSVNTVSSWEAAMPVYEWMELFYLLIYPWLLATPFIFRNSNLLRRTGSCAVWASAAGLYLQVVLPFHADHRPFVPQGILGNLILWERSVDGTTAAFPSFHVIWAFVAASAWGWRWPHLTVAWNFLACAIAASCVAIGVHSIADVVSGAMIGILASRYEEVSRAILDGAQHVANSWKEWMIGHLRIINHAIYPAVGATVGLLMMSLFVEKASAVFILLCLGVLGAALWGQWLEGSGKLARPFGYYGSVIGVGVMLWPVAASFDISWHLLGGAFALAAPWIQAIGRARCMVQGCCHGAPVIAKWGIRHLHPKSRVHAISGLAGVPLHATALYSMVANILLGGLLLRLVWSGADSSWISGTYLILSGLFRFVEEAWRGEVQTVAVKGLRIYQWLALVSIVFGMLVSTVDGVMLVANFGGFYTGLPWALAGGLLSAMAMGMDFPKSTRRFGRLS